MKNTNLRFLALALLAAACQSQAAVGAIRGTVQAVVDGQVADPSGAIVMLCDGPGRECKEVARLALQGSEGGDGISAAYVFTGQSKPLKVRAWRDENGNGVVDRGDLEGWYFDGLGDPARLSPGGYGGDITMYAVGSLEWNEYAGIGG
ncbi:MAG: hypothetical protein K0M64_08715 [Rhizobium sp.]|nr:hypothetical protein [Rhizobium sp.]